MKTEQLIRQQIRKMLSESFTNTDNDTTIEEGILDYFTNTNSIWKRFIASDQVLKASVLRTAEAFKLKKNVVLNKLIELLKSYNVNPEKYEFSGLKDKMSDLVGTIVWDVENKIFLDLLKDKPLKPVYYPVENTIKSFGK